MRVYLVGGATAVLLGWRGTTIDVDLVMRPEDDALLRAIPALKEELQIKVELASPADFIPVPPGWEDRGTFIGQVGRVVFFISISTDSRWQRWSGATGRTSRMCARCSRAG